MEINSENLIKSGYKEWGKKHLFDQYSNRFFQKRFRNEKGDTRYFIDFVEYTVNGKLDYEVCLQFEQDRYCMNIRLFAIDNSMSIEDVEQEVYAIWYGLDCKYYERNEDNE